MKLAELKGSEKQIAWAKDIRDSFIRRYETLKDKEIEEAILIKADVIRNAVEEVLAVEESSKFYIEKIMHKDRYDSLWVMLERYKDIKMTSEQKEDRKRNIVCSYEDYACVVELREVDDKFQFTAIKYPAVIGTMKSPIKAEEIGYNEYGQFSWEVGKGEMSIEEMSEWLQDLGFAVCIM